MTQDDVIREMVSELTGKMIETGAKPMGMITVTESTTGDPTVGIIYPTFFRGHLDSLAVVLRALAEILEQSQVDEDIAGPVVEVRKKYARGEK